MTAAPADHGVPDTPAAWAGGWYRAATACRSPNFGPRPPHTALDLVVLHSISLPPGEFGTGCVQQLFCNQLDWDAHPYFQQIRGLEVSAHFFITRDGALWQFVSCDDRAWHAGVSSWKNRPNCNDYAIGIELEGLEGELFAAPQYARLETLLSALVRAYPIRGIVGHEHIAPGRKADPGAGFDWALLQQLLQLPPDYFPENTGVSPAKPATSSAK